jgi:murein DD-endopeptidase MepM/ murein hydrolase activator NlpD
LARTAAESAQITSLLRLRQGCEPGASPHRGALVQPLPGSRVTTGYGWRTHPIYHRPQFHTGTDFAGRPRALAAAAGRVVDVGSRVGYGLTVVIDHGNGIGTVYAHLASATVRAGQSIAQGAAIGAVGHSGDATGDHLHFEVRVHGVTTDPLSWL